MSPWFDTYGQCHCWNPTPPQAKCRTSETQIKNSSVLRNWGQLAKVRLSRPASMLCTEMGPVFAVKRGPGCSDPDQLPTTPRAHPKLTDETALCVVRKQVAPSSEQEMPAPDLCTPDVWFPQTFQPLSMTPEKAAQRADSQLTYPGIWGGEWGCSSREEGCGLLFHSGPCWGGPQGAPFPFQNPFESPVCVRPSRLPQVSGDSRKQAGWVGAERL